MKLLKILLYPFSILYDATTRFRNHLYNINYKPSFHFETIVISVGNLRVGGTGKTPMVEYLIRLLKDKYKIATLSRGYGRKTNGFMIATETETAETVGDEPYQFFQKFKNEILVTVGEERAIAIPEILYHREDTDVILLDDAFQHRKVERDLNILLTTFEDPFFEDMLLPAGRLREAAIGAKRAEVIVVTKCPEDITAKQKQYYTSRIESYSRPQVAIFFSSIEYGEPVAIFNKNFVKPKRVAMLFSGLANPTPFEKHVMAHHSVIAHLTYHDHHAYTLKDAQQIKAAFEALEQEDKFILTTEKDMVKLLKPDLKSILADLPLFYLPISIKILDNQTKFDSIVINSVKKRKDSLLGII